MKMRLAVASFLVIVGCDFEALRIEACFDAGLCNDAGVPTMPGGGAAAGGSTAGGSTAGGSTAGGSTAGGSTAGGSTAGGSAAGGSTAGGSTAGGSAAGGSASPVLCLSDGGLCIKLIWTGGSSVEPASAVADVNGLTFSFTANGDGGTTAALWSIPVDGGLGGPVQGGSGTVGAATLLNGGTIYSTALIGDRANLQSALTQPRDAGAVLTRHGQPSVSVRFTVLGNTLPRPLLPTQLSALRTTLAGAEDVMVFSTVSDVVEYPPGAPFGGSGSSVVLWTAYRFQPNGVTRLGATAFSCLGNTSGLQLRSGLTLSDGGVCALISKSCVADDVKVVNLDNPAEVTVLRRDAGAAPGGELIVCGPAVPADAGVYTSRTVTIGPQVNAALTAGAGALYAYRNGNVDRLLPGILNSAAINAGPAGFVATTRGVFIVGTNAALNQGYLERLDPNNLRKLEEWRLSSAPGSGLNQLQLVAAGADDLVWVVGTAAPGATLSAIDGGSVSLGPGLFAMMLQVP